MTQCTSPTLAQWSLNECTQFIQYPASWTHHKLPLTVCDGLCEARSWERWWMKCVLRPLTSRVKCGKAFSFLSSRKMAKSWTKRSQSKHLSFKQMWDPLVHFNLPNTLCGWTASNFHEFSPLRVFRLGCFTVSVTVLALGRVLFSPIKAVKPMRSESLNSCDQAFVKDSTWW